MKALWELWAEAALDVVVHAQVALNDFSEIPDDLIGIFIEQALQFTHLLIVVEVLLILSIEFDEDALKVLKRLD